MGLFDFFSKNKSPQAFQAPKLFEIIQNSERIDLAYREILSNTITNQVTTLELDLDGKKYRFRANESVYNIDVESTFDLRIPEISFEKNLKFFKPIGFYYVDKPGKVAFMIMPENEELAINQDKYDFKKRINLHYDKNKFSKAIMAAFSAENKLILEVYHDAIANRKSNLISKTASTLITAEFNYGLAICGVSLKYIILMTENQIQIHLNENMGFSLPLFFSDASNKLDVLKDLEPRFVKLKEHSVLSWFF